MDKVKPLTKEQIKEKALRLLEFRNHSEYELRQKLIRFNADDDDINEVIDFCLNYGFLNDEKFAKSLAQDLSNLKKYGKNRIKLELLKRGIASQYIEEALADIDDSEDALIYMLEKRLKGSFDKKNCDKAIRYFIYRGYQLNDVINAIERLKLDEL